MNFHTTTFSLRLCTFFRTSESILTLPFFSFFPFTANNRYSFAGSSLVLAREEVLSRAGEIHEALKFEFEPVGLFFCRSIVRPCRFAFFFFFARTKRMHYAGRNNASEAPAGLSRTAGHRRTAGRSLRVLRREATSAVIGSQLFSRRSIRPHILDVEFSSVARKYRSLIIIVASALHLHTLYKLQCVEITILKKIITFNYKRNSFSLVFHVPWEVSAEMRPLNCKECRACGRNPTLFGEPVEFSSVVSRHVPTLRVSKTERGAIRGQSLPTFTLFLARKRYSRDNRVAIICNRYLVQRGIRTCAFKCVMQTRSRGGRLCNEMRLIEEAAPHCSSSLAYFARAEVSENKRLMFLSIFRGSKNYYISID